MKNPRLVMVFLVGASLSLAALGCGGGGADGEAEPTATPATTAAAAAHATATVDQLTESPVATVESKYDEAWARKQVEPYIKETYKILLEQEWNKAYDLMSDDAKVGCPRSTFVSKMAGVWLLMVAFGGEEVIKAEQQDLEEGKLAITFSEITPERITYTAGDDDEPSPLVREGGKWKSAEPLEQDCASLDMALGQTPSPGPATATAATATPKATPTPAAGLSRSNPIPLGQTAVVPPGWEITVVNVNGDAWTAIQAENPYNEPPREGYRMVLVTVRVTNVQTADEAATISEGDFDLVGSRNQVYKTYEQYCGVTPNGLGAELFPQGTVEGTVCLQVGIDETGLILIAGPSWDDEDQRYFALQ